LVFVYINCSVWINYIVGKCSMSETYALPKAFIFRKLHSITGLFLVLYLMEHLFVNSQAALWIGDDGLGFVRAVNGIHDLPFLPMIEIFLLGVPIAIHAWWGIVYLRTGKQNYYGTTDAKPHLNEYPRNRAYTWQRITSWVLLVGIIAHVIHMRFIEYPVVTGKGNAKQYLVRLEDDAGLEALAPRLNFQIYHGDQIQQHEEFSKAIHKPLKTNQVIAVANSFGLAELLMVRETFKMPIMIALYTIFVLAACFHAFNGLWTFMISWGITLTQRAQRHMLSFATFLMILIAFLGLSAIWLTYWINLKQ
jgi:succinate dehydrogenase / fumarate reductase cytochrome b subunit